MKTTVMTAALITGLLLVIPLTAQAGAFHGGLNLGYAGGLGMQASGTFMDFTRDLPLSARFTLGYSGAGPGDPYGARINFINDNTNGDPSKSATTWQMRFDLMFPAFAVGPQTMYVFAGPRYARYTASYNFVGGNEFFDVVSNPWGAGLGLESWFVMHDGMDFVLQAGVDWYQDAKIEGHDTAYLPSGDHINPRDGYDYATADEVIDQPQLEVLMMMGLRFKF